MLVLRAALDYLKITVIKIERASEYYEIMPTGFFTFYTCYNVRNDIIMTEKLTRFMGAGLSAAFYLIISLKSMLSMESWTRVLSKGTICRTDTECLKGVLQSKFRAFA